jgi:hypothetical protein
MLGLGKTGPLRLGYDYRSRDVTEGFALGFGWLELAVLLGWLSYFLLRHPR